MAEAAPEGLRADLRQLVAHLQGAVAGLVTFAPPLDGAQAAFTAAWGAGALDLLGWAWQRRAAAGWDEAAILAGVPGGWRALAAGVLRAWAGAVRASSAVETWHSVLRPHLAVHRRLSPGLLALLAVWHNHQVAARGEHRGRSPLQRHGWPQVPTDGLVALGYPPPTASRPGECSVAPTAGAPARLLAWPTPPASRLAA